MRTNGIRYVSVYLLASIWLRYTSLRSASLRSASNRFQPFVLSIRSPLSSSAFKLHTECFAFVRDFVAVVT